MGRACARDFVDCTDPSLVSVVVVAGGHLEICSREDLVALRWSWLSHRGRGVGEFPPGGNVDLTLGRSFCSQDLNLKGTEEKRYEHCPFHRFPGWTFSRFNGLGSFARRIVWVTPVSRGISPTFVFKDLSGDELADRSEFNVFYVLYSSIDGSSSSGV